MAPDLFDVAQILDPVELHTLWKERLAQAPPREIVLDIFEIAAWKPTVDDRRDHPGAYFSAPGGHDIAEGYVSFKISSPPSTPPWNIAFSKRLQKDLDGLDRKLAGRVLEVLLE